MPNSCMQKHISKECPRARKQLHGVGRHIEPLRYKIVVILVFFKNEKNGDIDKMNGDIDHDINHDKPRDRITFQKFIPYIVPNTHFSIVIGFSLWLLMEVSLPQI